MKRWQRSVLAACVALALGCEETPTAPVAGVEGAHDLAAVGDLVFVTNAQSDELRVINLGMETPGFVPAPNPLHSLSIPVVERPVDLARDVIWEGGQARGGRFVYALGSGGAAISVVDARLEEGLVEVQRAQLTGAGTFTAMAAVGDAGGAGESHLYAAVFEGDSSRLYRYAVSGEGPLVDREHVATFACGAILAVAVLPEGKLAFGGRRNPGLGSCGGADPSQTAFLFDPETKTSTPLDFGGPVRSLLTHPRSKDLEEGTLIYGILDEASCAGEGCRGLVATLGRFPGPRSGPDCGGALGAPACDVTGNRMRPVDVGSALIMGVDVAEGLSVGLDPEVVERETPSSLQGVLTTSEGQILFFDAGNLRHLDTDLEAPSLGTVVMRDPQGTSLPVVGGPSGVTLTDGAAKTEVIELSYLGALPGFSGLVVTSPTSLDVPEDPTGIVQAGDLVFGQEEACAQDQATVVAVSAAPGGGGTVTVDPALTPGCAVAIRPPDAGEEWVAFGTVSGFLGRFTASGATSVSLPPTPALQAAQYYRHPPGFTAPKPLLKMTFTPPTPEDLDRPLARNDRYELPVQAHFQPVRVGVVARGFRSDVAGAAVYLQDRGDLMVSFPAGLEQLFTSVPETGEVVVQLHVGNLVAGIDVDDVQPFR